MKAIDLKVTQKFLNKRADECIQLGYQKQKWIIFSEILLANGFDIYLYEAKRTKSKYLTVTRSEQEYKVRFSNHKPIKHRELGGDCDFFVGMTHTGIRTTEDALVAVGEYFKVKLKR